MIDGVTSGLGMLLEWLSKAAIFIVALLSWNWRLLHNDVQEIKRNYVPSRDIERAIDRLSAEIREQRKETHDDIKGLHVRIDATRDK